MPDFDYMRWHVDDSASRRTHNVSITRPCPDCGQELGLCSGRNSGKFFWSHVQMGACEKGGIGGKIVFDDREAAINAEKIWKVINNAT